MNALNHLEPKLVWQFFEEITKVPRPSKKEEKIIKYLLDFGKKHGLETKRDKAGNVLISKPAVKGFETRPTVVLQSHMDMVCEKLAKVEIDFDNDAITPVIDGDWVKAKGTTLGADDGMGVAAQLAILASSGIQHGKIECLFTVDEETGLTGAFALEKGFITGKILLNLDSEDEGEMFIGCAGGVDTVAVFDYFSTDIPKGAVSFEMQVSGLKGGHSGDEIHKGLGNSVKIAARFLHDISKKFPVYLSYIDAGNKRNAIPREALVKFAVDSKNVGKLKASFKTYVATVKAELERVESKLEVTMLRTHSQKKAVDQSTLKNLLMALMACPHGVINMSPAIQGLVETSTNLASVKMPKGKNKKIVVTTSQRSSLESGKKYVRDMVHSVFELAGANIKHSDGYPGWAPNPQSEVLKVVVKSYEDLFGVTPVVRAIHAGLECGLFLEKYPDLDMVSFGPTLRDVHTPDERVNIPSVEKWWKHLIDVLKKIK